MKVEVLVEQKNTSFKSEIWNHEKRFSFPGIREWLLQAGWLKMQTETLKYSVLPTILAEMFKVWWFSRVGEDVGIALVESRTATLEDNLATFSDIKKLTPFIVCGSALGQHSYTRGMHKYVHCSLTVNSKPLETAIIGGLVFKMWL